MASLRTLAAAHRGVLALLLACALAARLLIPGGFMPQVTSGALALILCPDVVPAQAVTTAMPGMHHDTGTGDGGEARADMPCAFAGLGAPALGSADAPLPAAAVLFAFLVVVLLGAARVPPAPPPRLRPPLRAPPLIG